MSVGFGKAKDPLGGAQHLRIVRLSAETGQAASSGVGSPLIGEALELFLEGLHLSINEFDSEEHCQSPDGSGGGVRDQGRSKRLRKLVKGRRKGGKEDCRREEKMKAKEAAFCKAGVPRRHWGMVFLWTIWCGEGGRGMGRGRRQGKARFALN